VLTESFGRLLNQKDGVDADTYNKSDVRTEIFVIGSVYYTLLRGYESYKTESWNRDYFVILDEKFQKKKFPLLTDSAGDTIVRKCWNRKYQLISELLAEVADSNRQDKLASEDRE